MGNVSLPVFLIILEVNMKSSQSKFSNKKTNSGAESSLRPTSSKVSGCCCGSKFSEEIEETEIEEDK